MQPEAKERRQGRLFVVSGPSGAGKSTLCQGAARRTDAYLSVSATTRPCGPHETEGRDYYFLSEAEFQARLAAGEFLEHARVFDHYYGTPAEPVRQMLGAGRNVILEIDVQGAAQVFARMPEAVGVLVLPPCMETLRQRLLDRRRDSAPTIEKRLAQAQREIDEARATGRYRYAVVNEDLPRAIDELATIVK
jgi:guanylate kinase